MKNLRVLEYTVKHFDVEEGLGWQKLHHEKFLGMKCFILKPSSVTHFSPLPHCKPIVLTRKYSSIIFHSRACS